ncbi:ribonuclease III [Candidatus Magnetominusculus xianensis]|uniref:Ribonuclease 3 n=1 Tax=Candidatus Magnetominusculus xianensis TaxID=1748249 RepID=A0ABR5SHW7_9BACT|nr:ribonuclease III [Candidatus Magnetominusculus xianensis]KWT90502.1 ribonuclease III [Candidatus Magnetominusculus xianensis]MBF0404172.1 ribonuclease III [Nitrospirota bacterium]
MVLPALLTALEQSLNYYFNDKELLVEAVTHRSYYHECLDKSQQYNERVEFLGDSVLGLAISETLYVEKVFCKKNNKLVHTIFSESEMSRLKSYLVSKKILSQLALDMNLGQYLKLGKGEEMTGGREKHSLLANTLEAIFGAVFLDGGYDTAKTVIIKLYQPVLTQVLSSHTSFDYKTELQEISQKLFSSLPEYKLALESGNDHDKDFVYEVYLGGKCMGSGSGKNKKSAQSEAARVALEAIACSKTIDEPQLHNNQAVQ